MINNFKGLKFPDEYLTRFFFKEKLYKKKNNVLELGCGNGNSLNLFYQYGWDTFGIDIDPINIKRAKNNFRILKKKFSFKNEYFFLKDDMLNFIKTNTKKKFNTIIFSNSIYYLESDKIIKILTLIRDNNIKKNSQFFFRIRLDNDERKHLSKKISKNTYKINFKFTNEYGSLNTFFSKIQFLKILKNIFKVKKIITLNNKYENIVNNKIITNSDLVLWFKI